MIFWITLATFSVKCTLTTFFLGDFGKILFGQLFIPTSGHTGNPSANWTPIPTLLYLRTKVIWKRYISTSFWRRQNVTQTSFQSFKRTSTRCRASEFSALVTATPGSSAGRRAWSRCWRNKMFERRKSCWRRHRRCRRCNVRPDGNRRSVRRCRSFPAA